MRSIAALSSSGSFGAPAGPTNTLQPIMEKLGAEPLVHELHPPAHAPAVARIVGHQLRAGKGLVDVFHDRRRFGEHALTMAHRRNRSLRIDRQIVRLVLVEVQQVEVVAVERHALFHQRQHRLAGIGVGFPVIQGDVVHPARPPFCKRCIPSARPPVKRRRALGTRCAPGSAYCKVTATGASVKAQSDIVLRHRARGGSPIGPGYSSSAVCRRCANGSSEKRCISVVNHQEKRVAFHTRRSARAEYSSSSVALRLR